jgi:universal stress protein A
MYLLAEETPRNVIAVRVFGKLTGEDYRSLVPVLEERLRQMRQVNLIIELEDFQGWELDAAWGDLKFGIEHNRRIDRLAVVGERDWERWMTKIAGWFLHGEVRYFDHDDIDDAWAWIERRQERGE